VSWNIDLPEASQAEALALADRVRERDGGLPGVRALGLYLTLAGVAQVSMHLENFRLTSPGTAMAALRREAERLGVEVGEGELIGLIPGEALRGQSPSALGLAGFRPGQVLEAQLRTLWRRTD
jgi:glutamate formiminotransferase